MKQLFFYLAVLILLTACESKKSEKQDNENQISNSSTSIEYNTEDGIPLVSPTTMEPTKLKYNFTKGDSARLLMDYQMSIETMGMNIPLEMKMESDYLIEEVDDSVAQIVVKVSRIAMKMDGPQPMQFDSNNPGELENSPAAGALGVMLNKSIQFSLSKKGKLVHMNVDQIMDILPEDASGKEKEMVKQQIQSTFNQLSQNSFVVLPETPVKVGDVYQGGAISNHTGIVKMDINMQYKVLSISKDRSYVLLEPIGDIAMEGTEKGGQMKIENSKVSGWMLLNLQKGILEAGNIDIAVDIVSAQMGQEMKSILNMSIAMKLQ